MEPFEVKNQLLVVNLPGYGNGHWAIAMPVFWEDVVGEFLRMID